MRWLIALVFLLQIPLAGAPFSSIFSPADQTTPVITSHEPESKFGEQITFKARVEPFQEMKELVVFITPEGQPTVWQRIDLDQGSEQGEFSQTVRARQLALFPFSRVAYRFEATMNDGEIISSEPKTFTYDDDRYKWQNMQAGPFDIFWNSGEPTLGQDIANIAQQGLERGLGILPVESPEKLRIYAYTSAHDLQTALQLTNQPWVAGHATPQLSMVMISVPTGPEKNLELRRQVPHEIMHILQYQVMGKSFNQQPVWLVEGMASLAELTVNPEYRTVLKATEPQQILPFRSLCIMFPREAASAFQAYAQSESFVGFLQQKFGSDGLMRLIEKYNSGVGCEEGVASAFGFSLNQLQSSWEQETLGINAGGLAFTNLLPYLLLALLILLPAVLAFVRLNKSEPAEDAL
ncbi:MAG: hypothetical protein EHM21_04790 [Chloroflexi bacterium]|nr:MAG: hypothetical protein EHM21_04790 [Chloroflexota bacterium]